MPKITAQLEYLDETLMRVTPAIFAAGIDLNEDKNGHTSHLVITTVERQALIRTLKRSFGAKLNDKNQNYNVVSAVVLLSYLQNKGFKSSDEPW